MFGILEDTKLFVDEVLTCAARKSIQVHDMFRLGKSSNLGLYLSTVIHDLFLLNYSVPRIGVFCMLVNGTYQVALTTNQSTFILT